MRVRLRDNERVVVRTRPHLRAILWPVVRLMLLILVTSMVAGFLNRQHNEPLATIAPVLQWIVIGIGALLALKYGLLPIVRWLTTSVVLTTQRVIVHRQGTDREVPLENVFGVDLRQSMAQKINRSGTLILRTAQGNGIIYNVPAVQTVADLVVEYRDALAPRMVSTDRWAL
ncbi:PH domain-containing protein [Neomicrococcus aestuarii]|uniref:PH domain-containing protein n=1 Tax=Neomicrococcus aestuarii TaxID=556325 RepID=UPI0012EEBA1B|nr:PH domain-containing protein [Neomicrococcus aestuarii]